MFEQCNNQYIFSPSGAVGLDLKAVWLVFDMMHIPDDERLELWEKLQSIADALLEDLRQDAERKAKMRKNG